LTGFLKSNGAKKFKIVLPNSEKENSGASGGFLPKPLLLRLRHPNSKKMSRVFCEILSPKNSFRKTESALVPPPARILGGQNTKEKCPFLFRRNLSRANPKSKEHFSLVSAEALRGGGEADSFVQFPLEKSSSKVYNYSTAKFSSGRASLRSWWSNPWEFDSPPRHTKDASRQDGKEQSMGVQISPSALNDASCLGGMEKSMRA